MPSDNHCPDYSFAGEAWARVGDLKAGDQIPVLGDAAVLTALDATHDTDNGTTTMRIDASPNGPGPLLLASAGLVNIRRPEPEPDEDEGEDDEENSVTVSLTVTEEVTGFLPGGPGF